MTVEQCFYILELADLLLQLPLKDINIIFLGERSFQQYHISEKRIKEISEEEEII